MSNTKTLSLFIAILLLLGSCKKEIEFTADEQANRLVLNTLITANHHTSKTIPVAGKTYELKASSSGFNQIAGKTAVPELVRLNSIDSITTYDHSETTYYVYEISLDDPAGIKNYYSLSVLSEQSEVIAWDTTLKATNYIGELYIYPENQDQNFTNDPLIDFNTYSTIYFSDSFFDGDHFSFRFSISKPYSEKDIKKIYFKLNSLDKNIFYYLKSVNAYHNTSIFDEPVSIFNNIENGFGIVGSQNIYTDSLNVFIPSDFDADEGMYDYFK